MTKKLKGDFRKYMDKSFLGAWDVPEHEDLVLTIDYTARDEVQNDRGREKKLTIHFKENYKPMICNTTNATAISKAYHSKKVEDWENKRISIYKAVISAFGQEQECLRVRDYPPRTNEYICEECGTIITDYGKYKSRVIAENAMTKFGRYLCYNCVSAKNNAENNEGI